MRDGHMPTSTCESFKVIICFMNGKTAINSVSKKWLFIRATPCKSRSVCKTITSNPVHKKKRAAKIPAQQFESLKRSTYIAYYRSAGRANNVV